MHLPSLAVDLGGTHIRFRLVGNPSRPAPVHTIGAHEVKSVEHAIARWRDRTGVHEPLDAVAIAAAGPVIGDRVRITNLGWTLEAGAIEHSCGAERCLLVNDITAVAWALLSLDRDDVRELEDAAPDRCSGEMADPGTRTETAPRPPHLPESGADPGPRAEEARAPDEPSNAAIHPRPPGGDTIDAHKSGADNPDAGAARAVIAPGTGLGISGLVPAGAGRFAVIEGEGGHRMLAASTTREWAIVTALAERFGHASAERALSGPGIEAIHDAIASIEGTAPCEGERSAAEIARDAFAGADPIAEETIATFTGFLGSVAGDLALTLGARGGVYIAGGIVPAWGECFDTAHFLDRFRAKGRFRDYLSAIPVYVVTHPYPALAGVERLLAHRFTGPYRGPARAPSDRSTC